jgi:hypothetical protein
LRGAERVFDEGFGEGGEEVGVDEYGYDDIWLAGLDVADEAGEGGEVVVVAGEEGGCGDAGGLEEGGDFAEGGDGDDVGVEAALLEAGGEVGKEEGAAAAMEVGDEESETWHEVNGN